MANTVTIGGTITRLKSGSGEKGPYAFATIKPEGEPGLFGVIAFDDAAESLASAGENAEVTVNGRLWRKKDRKTEQWETVIRADRVS